MPDLSSMLLASGHLDLGRHGIELANSRENLVEFTAVFAECLTNFFGIAYAQKGQFGMGMALGKAGRLR